MKASKFPDAQKAFILKRSKLSATISTSLKAADKSLASL